MTVPSSEETPQTTPTAGTAETPAAAAATPAPAKPPVSPVRNAVGLIVLIAVLVFGVVEFRFKSQYSSAVNALTARAEDENKELMTESEAKTLLGRDADGPGVDVASFGSHYTKKSYSWPGLLGSRTLSVYYTKQTEPRVHHYETADAKLAEPPARPAPKYDPPPKTNKKGSRGGGLAPEGVVD